jgi:hypothetical protein
MGLLLPVYTHRLMPQPLMRNHHLTMRLQPALDPPRLPVPEHDIPRTIARRDPLAVGRKADLAGVPGNGVAGEPLLPVLSEVFGAVDEDLVVEGLGGEIFHCGEGVLISVVPSLYDHDDAYERRTHVSDVLSPPAYCAYVARQCI